MESKKALGPIHAHDDTRINDTGKRIGSVRITDTPNSGGKWIGEVFHYGGSEGNFPDHEEAKAYAQLFAAAPDLLKAIELALNIKDLWAPVNYSEAEHEGEAQALQAMMTTLEAAYQKAATSFPVNHQ